MEIPENDLPLFPLNAVLFPQARLPLHIFEPRYREMINRCLRENLAFGVVFIREGVEVGGEVTLHSIGTIAHVVDVERLADGRMNIVVKGVTRFRLLALSSTRTYLTGSVELLRDQVGDSTQIEAAQREAGRLFEKYIRDVQAAGESEEKTADQELTLPNDPTLLSYVVASILPLSPQDKQTLLEAETSVERLRREVPMLEREMELLRLVSRPSGVLRDQGPFSLS
jgi:uncharacterized protein